MRRREFVAGLAIATATGPARAQRLSKPLIGMLSPGTPANSRLFRGLWDGLRELGYIEGQNVAIEFRSAEGKYERLPALASELVGLKPRLILASTSASTHALKDLTTSIPVVMVAVSDPVGSGFVESLARPGANLTGISINQVGLIQKQMQLLKEVQPTISRIAVTWNPSNPAHAAFLIEAEAASTKLNVDVFGVRCGWSNSRNAAGYH